MTDDTTPNENAPTGGGGEPGPDDPTREQPATGGPEDPTREQPPTAHAGPRRLYRSRDDRVLAGVCAGIANYFRIDPVIVRVVAIALVFLGGTGVIAYVAAWLLIPSEGEDGAPAEGPSRGVTIAGAILLVIALAVAFRGPGWVGWSIVPLGLVALAGLLIWRVASGERPQGDTRAVLRAIGLGLVLIAGCLVLAFGAAWAAAAGGAGVVAGVVVAAGLALIAGAFVSPRAARWLIVPALAVALPAGAVAAADIDVKGGYGEKTYRPGSSIAVRDHYRVGAGKLVVDLREANLTPGDHHIKLDVGVGEAQLVVPRNVCVSSDAHVGIGGAQVFDRDTGGIDVDNEEQRNAPPGTPRVVVDTNVGLGAFSVHHLPDQDWRRVPGNYACT